MGDITYMPDNSQSPLPSAPPPLNQLIGLFGQEKADLLRAESINRGCSLERLLAEIINSATDQVLRASGVQEQVREEISQ